MVNSGGLNTIMSTKERRQREAADWLKNLEAHHMKSINYSIKHTTSVPYDEVNIEVIPRPHYEHTKIAIFKNDTATCAITSAKRSKKRDRTCVLDFASFRHPGGGFIAGAIAQEESLCGVSGLYPCLAAKISDYEKRYSRLNGGLYDDDYIYVQKCPFIRNGVEYKADVIAIAAPNKTSFMSIKDAIQHGKEHPDLQIEQLDYISKITEQDFSDALYQRMKVAFLVPSFYGCTKVILGAFGCGVFGNDVEEVAYNWEELIYKHQGLYRQVVFALTDPNIVDIYKDIFEKNNSKKS